MNNLFVDIYESQNKSLNLTSVTNKMLLKTFGYILKEDKLLKTKTSSNIFLNLDKEKVLDLNKNKKAFKRSLKFLLKNKRNITVVFSRIIKNTIGLEDSIKKLFDQIGLDFRYIDSLNKLKTLDISYIERYMTIKKINPDRFKLLVAIDDILDFDFEKFLEYILKYKCVDILKMQDITKYDYKKLAKVVENINNEYGSSVQIIQKRNLQNYDFCILYTENQKEYFKSHYVLKREAYILDITNVDDDILSKEYKIYEKNKSYIETIFKRMKLDVNEFCKVDLGKLYN